FAMGIALGIARHALDEITEQAVQKGRNFQPSSLSTHPHFQFALGKAELELAAARALAFQGLSCIWDEACAVRIRPPEEQAASTRSGGLYHRASAACDDSGLSGCGRQCSLRYQSSAAVLP